MPPQPSNREKSLKESKKWSKTKWREHVHNSLFDLRDQSQQNKNDIALLDRTFHKQLREQQLDMDARYNNLNETQHEHEHSDEEHFRKIDEQLAALERRAEQRRREADTDDLTGVAGMFKLVF